jgi:integrase
MANNKIGSDKKMAKTTKSGVVKNQKWQKFLEFNSVKVYLNGSINSKKTKIANEVSFEEKIQKVNLTNYLRGLEVYLDEYCDFAKTPFELIKYYEDMRKADDKEGIAEFKQNVESFIVWLKNEKGLAGTTAMNYQAHLRGFLKWNDVVLRFKNYDERSEKAMRKAKFSIDFYKELEMAKKLIGYTKNSNLKMCMKWFLISGLGSKEIFSLTYGDLRYLDYSKDLVRIDSSREKSGVNFTTYIYGEVKDLIQKYLEMNQDGEDSGFWLNEEPNKAYHRYEKMFSNAYRNMVEQEYPELSESKRKVFTFHSYRGIFITICRDLRVPLHIENQFVAHSDDRLTSAYASAKDLESNFKLVQEELFGVRESDTREHIEKEIIDRILDNILNKGKRQTIFQNFDDDPKKLQDEDSDMRVGYMVQKIIETVKAELLEDSDFIKELKSKL